jgi:hypothetical protein
VGLDIIDSGASAIVPSGKKKTLQKLRGDEYFAQAWNVSNGGTKLDRSGKLTRHAGGQYFSYGQDFASPVPGMSASAFNGIKGTSNAPFLIDNIDENYLVSTGMTFCTWVQRAGNAYNGYDECWMLGWFGNYASAIPLYWVNSTDPAYGGLLRYWGNARAAAPTFKLIVGRWHFVSVSVQPGATGDVTIGMDGVYQVFPGVGHVSIGTSRMAIGGPDFDGSYARVSCGAIFDTTCYDKPLSQAECTKQLRSTGY